MTPAERAAIERDVQRLERIAHDLRHAPGGFAPPLAGLVDRIRNIAADLSDLTATKEPARG